LTRIEISVIAVVLISCCIGLDEEESLITEENLVLAFFYTWYGLESKGFCWSSNEGQDLVELGYTAQNVWDLSPHTPLIGKENYDYNKNVLEILQVAEEENFLISVYGAAISHNLGMEARKRNSLKT
jgi:hypothetical protein